VEISSALQTTSFQTMQNISSFIKSNKVASALVAGLIVSNGVLVGAAFNSEKSVVSSVPTASSAALVPSYAPLVTKSKMVSIVKADSATYYNQTATITTEVEVDDYFNFGFRDSEGTHYSFIVRGADYDYLHAYGPRAEFKSLFDYLAKNGGKANVKVKITTSSQHGDNAIWSIVGWEKA